MKQSEASPIRLTIFTSGVYPFQTHGAEVGIYYLARELTHLGFAPTIYLTEFRYSAVSVENLQFPEGLRISHYSGLRNRFLYNILFIIHVLRRVSKGPERSSLVVVNTPTLLSLASAYLTKRVLGMSYIVIVHGPSDLVERPALVRRVQCSLLRASSRTVCVSSALSRFLETCISKPRSISIIPNGFDPSEVHSLVTRGNSHDRSWEIVFVGALDENKDPLSALKCFKLVVSRLGMARLIIVGEGPLHKKLHDFVQDNDLKEHVTFLGRMSHSDLLKRLAHSELLILTSRSEGTPTVVIEALAMGKPVIATDTGGIPEIVKTGVNGYTYPIGCMDLMAEGIIKILSDDNLRRRLSRGATKSVENYSWPEIAQEYSRLLLSLMKS